jgi:Asp-tRNAAsn/Glu-tRNAGln amidotransferase A subunit and related amidases
VSLLICDIGTIYLPPIRKLTFKKASEGHESAHFTLVDLVKAYVARVGEVSEFNVALQLNSDAIRDARTLDEEWLESGSSSQLPFLLARQHINFNRSSPHGITLLIKDNIATKYGKLDVSAGSCAGLGAKPTNESSMVAKLQAADDVILGKTNLLG